VRRWCAPRSQYGKDAPREQDISGGQTGLLWGLACFRVQLARNFPKAKFVRFILPLGAQWLNCTL
jgi:hypothetical protein